MTNIIMTQKKVITLIVIMTCLILLFALSSQSYAITHIPVNIMVCQPTDTPQTNDSTIGFLQALSESALVEGIDYTITTTNTLPTKPIEDKTLNIIYSPAIESLSSNIEIHGKTSLIVSTAYTSNIESQFFNTLKPNVSGTYNEVMPNIYVSLMQSIQPEARRIGIIYDSNEKIDKDNLQKYHSLELREIYIHDIDINNITALGDDIDCIIDISTTKHTDILANISTELNKRNVPMYSANKQHLLKYYSAIFAVNQYYAGIKAGETITRMIRRASTNQENIINIEAPPKYDVHFNASFKALLTDTILKNIQENTLVANMYTVDPE